MTRNLVWFTLSLLVLVMSIFVVTYRFNTPSFLNLILVSLSLGTWLAYFLTSKSKDESFIKNYLLTIVIKLLAGGILIFVLIYIDPTHADENAILFLVTYVLQTGLEVGFLFKKFSAI